MRKSTAILIAIDALKAIRCYDGSPMFLWDDKQAVEAMTILMNSMRFDETDNTIYTKCVGDGDPCENQRCNNCERK